MHAAFIGIGSNLDGPLEQCRRAVEEIGLLPQSRITSLSSFYQTEPLTPKEGGATSTPWFVNAVCRVETSLEPLELFEGLGQIESRMGRTRVKKWEPRLIDLDILTYDYLVMEEGRLILPHPQMTRRRFVLEPLAEIAPDWTHPVIKKSAADLLGELSDSLKVLPLWD